MFAHRFLIGISTVFCLVFGVLQLDVALDGGGLPSLVLGIVFIVAGLGLGFYLKNMSRILGDDSSS